MTNTENNDLPKIENSWRLIYTIGSVTAIHLLNIGVRRSRWTG